MSAETLQWLASTIAQVFAALAALTAVFAVLLLESISRRLVTIRDLYVGDENMAVWAGVVPTNKSDLTP